MRRSPAPLLLAPIAALALLPFFSSDAAAQRAHLGVQVATEEAGLRVVGVRPGSPAQRAGIAPGDVILSVDGIPTPTIEELAEAVGRRRPGDRATLRIRRGASEIALEVELGAAPLPEAQDSPTRRRGSDAGGRPGAPDEDRGPTRRPRRRLGLRISPSERGLAVAEVVPGSPAERIGLEAGDVILAVDGKPVQRAADLLRALRDHGPDAPLELRVLRDGAETTLTVPPERLPRLRRLRRAPAEQRPSAPENAPARPWLGVYLAPADGGVRIEEVVPDGPAARAGLQAGDVVLEIDGRTVESPEALVGAIAGRAPGDAVRLRVLRGGERIDLTVRLGARTDTGAPTPPAESPRESEDRAGRPGPAPLPRGRLGIEVEQTAEGALVVVSVRPHSPAERAGFREGDRITAVGDRPVGTLDELAAALRRAARSGGITVTVERDGRRLTLGPIGPSNRPEPGAGGAPGARPPSAGRPGPQRPSAAREGERARRGYLGVVFASDDGPALVLETLEGSPAARAGLRAGDVIVEVDGAPAASARDVTRALRGKAPGDVVRVAVRRGNERLVVEVRLGERPRIG